MPYKIAQGPCWLSKKINWDEKTAETEQFATLAEADKFSLTSWNVPEGREEGYHTCERINPDSVVAAAGVWLGNHVITGAD